MSESITLTTEPWLMLIMHNIPTTITTDTNPAPVPDINY